MATQTVEYAAASGLTLTTKLFPVGSDTATASVAATENTNRLGWYDAVYTDVPAATYLLVAIDDASGLPVAIWDVILTLTTATFQAGVGISGGDATAANQTTILAAITSANLVGPGSIETPVEVQSGGVDIPNVECWVSTDLVGSNVIAGTLTSNDQGLVTFWLDAGTYYLWRSSALYTFPNPTTLTVS